jgi:hypothetical protein
MRVDLQSTLSGAIILVSMWAASLEAQQPPPGNVQATASGPTRVKLTWTAPAAANGYIVQRGIGQNALERLTPDKITTTAYTDAAAPASSALRYRVKAFFPGGATSLSAIVSVTTPSAASNTASGTQPNQQLAAAPSADRSAIVREPHQAGFTAVPASPVLATPGAAPAAASSGRYRVVANGFSVVQQAHSNHDDVYGGFVMLHFNRQNGELLDRDARHTNVLGDINGRVFGETDGGSFPRLHAGTASASGGLRNGDSYPDAGHARFRGADGIPPNRQTFPFEIWTGDLTNASDAIVILPTLWSRDGKTQPYDDWQTKELSAGSQIWYDQAVQEALRQTSLGVVAPPGAITPNGNQRFSEMAKLVGLAIVGGMGQPWVLGFAFDPSAHDFPIGFDPGAKALPRRAIVLTREMIEQALNSPKLPLNTTMVVPNYPAWILPYLDAPVGVIPVLLFDRVPPPGEPLRTSYVMYLQVERI